jgi:ParB/RepB/Spo0J family partition protein
VISPAFGTKKYAFEELVAEINAAFCCASLGITPTVRHADYIGSWLEVLREDNRAIVRAASQASKAADWLLGFCRTPMSARPTTSARRRDDLRKPESGEASFRLHAFPPPRRCPPESERAALRFVTGWRSRERLSAARRGVTIMATAIQKITLSSARDIPFNKLVLSQSNVRRVKAGVSIEELAESIARRGLIQSLHVRPVLDADGAETGMFEVPAGGRRYRALELLVKQKRLAKTAPVPCVVGDANSDILVDEVSLVENIERAPLHPLDQFRAFQAMRDKGMTEEAIAAAFFVGVNIVKQRLRLASVSPVLLEIYAEDGMTLEQLMAFTVSSDHARQEQVWDAIKDSWQKEPYHIRRMLTETTVRASDKRAVFVGVEAYEAAGGIVLRDLFQSDDGGWLQDPALLDRLVAEKLKAAADEIAAKAGSGSRPP